MRHRGNFFNVDLIRVRHASVASASSTDVAVSTGSIAHCGRVGVSVARNAVARDVNLVGRAEYWHVEAEAPSRLVEVHRVEVERRNRRSRTAIVPEQDAIVAVAVRRQCARVDDEEELRVAALNGARHRLAAPELEVGGDGTAKVARVVALHYEVDISGDAHGWVRNGDGLEAH